MLERMLEFEIRPTEAPWSTNQDRNLHPMTRAARIKAWKEDTILGYMALGYKKQAAYIGEGRYAPPSIIQIEIGFPKTRRRDPHNYCGTVLKAVIDGLVQKGLWPDDTPEWVGHREPLLVEGETTKVRIWETQEKS